MPSARLVRAASALLAVGLLTSAPATAQQADSDDTNAQVNPGALSIHDGLVADFPTLALTGTAQKTTAAMAPFEVRDLRGTGAGYSVTAQATQMKQHDGTAYVASGRTLPVGSLDYAGVTGVTADGTDSTAPAADAGPFTIDSASGAVQVASAASGAGMGVFDFASPATAAMTLAVPGDAYAASYRSDVTLSLVTGPAGGSGGGGETTSPAYVMQDVWTAQADMRAARHVAAAAGSGGLVYAIGGFNGSAMAAAERFDPATGQWSSIPFMPGGARYGLAAATDTAGRIYAMGGNSGSSWINRVERFDPATGAWETLPSLPTNRGYFAAAADAQGRIYAVGGTGSSGSLTRVDRFDPATNAWTRLPDLPGGRDKLAGAADAQGRIYAIGGSASGAAQARVDRFDPATGAWTQLPNMPGGAREDLTAAADGKGRIYAVGGYVSTPLARAERFDPETGAWEKLADMPGGGRRSPAAASDADGRVYVTGGYNGSALARVERYE